MGCRIAVLVLSVIAAMTVPASAQETGSISGYVFDQSGQIVADAAVKVSSDLLPGGRTTATTAAGEYRLPLLLPGTYVIEVEKTGTGTSKRTVVVEVARDTQVDVVLGLNVQEDVTVTATLPDVNLKSTEVNFNYGRELIENLPLQRTYAGLFQLIPGVADNNSFAPNGGASRQDNTYLVDGVNITNPGFGYLATEINAFDIQEFSVKRGAITAEFGRASGFVTNAITRSGTNQLRGGVRFEAIPKGLIADSKDPNLGNNRSTYATSAGLGGPLVKDRLFWYASAQLRRTTESDRVNRVGAVPDRETSVNEGFGKITYAPSQQHFFNVSYRHRPQEDEFAGVGPNDAPEVATNSEGTNRVATAVWDWFINARTTLDVKYLHMSEGNETVAVTDLGSRGTFDVNNPVAMGFFTDPQGFNRGGAQLLLNQQNYKRDEIKATLTRFLDFRGTSHQLKAGFGWDEGSEDLTRVSNAWGGVTIVQSNTQVQARYYPNQPSQLSPGRTWSLFVQDDISIGQRMTINAGLLLNRDEYIQELATSNTFLTFGFGDEIQPRLGVNYNLRKDAGDKVYANYGRYYSMDQKSSSRSLAPNRLFTNDALFDRTTGALISDAPGANVTGKVLRDMDPTYMDEIAVGYATPLFGSWSLDVFYLYRDTDDFIEDQPSVLPASTFFVDNLENGERKYKAFTIELNRRLRNQWSMNASYAWSRLEGNFDLDYAGGTTTATAVFNTSSILQDGPGVFVEDRNRYGPLSQDRTHVFKLFATWVPTEAITLGGYLRTQSGAPFEARGQDWYGGYRRYLEPAGTDRNDVWTNLDLLAAYRFALGSRAGLRIEGRVLNLFDTQTAITRDNRQFLDARVRYATGSLPAGCDAACSTDAMVQGTASPNPLYGSATLYAPSRRLLLTAQLDF
jgi:hypothetical protein